MKARTRKGLDHDPCRPIQLDLSCMMDGELGPAAVRRVLVHMEVCPKCREFFNQLRRQVKAHQDPWGFMERGIGRSSSTRGPVRSGGKEKQLHLAQIFYELGKAYVLLSVSPGFRREVAVEPVPVPDQEDPGAELVERFVGGAVRRREGGRRWVMAQALLEERLESPEGNLAKGTQLLEEALDIMPRFFEARIYLGHAKNLGGDLEGSCEEFRRVLRASRSLPIRGFALENLGNVYLQMGCFEDAARCFRRVVYGEVLSKEPRFFTSWFNLGLAYALMGRFEESKECFRELYDGFPEKRKSVGEMFAGHRALGRVLEENPRFAGELRRAFPEFFSSEVKP